MPNIPIPNYWREQIKYILGENEQGRTREPVREITRQLNAHAEELRQRGDPKSVALSESVPSSRTIGRVREEWDDMKDSERSQYQLLHWPDSMERGRLVWEAAPVVIELLNIADEYSLPRPPLPIARWLWWVTQSVPVMDIRTRLHIALLIAAHREAGLPLPESSSNNPIQSYLRARVPFGGPIGFWSAGLILNIAFDENESKNQQEN